MRDRQRIRRRIASRSRSSAAVYFQIIVLATALVWLLLSMKSLSLTISDAFSSLAEVGAPPSTGSGEGSAAVFRDVDRRMVGMRTDLVLNAPAADGSGIDTQTADEASGDEPPAADASGGRAGDGSGTPEGSAP